VVLASEIRVILVARPFLSAPRKTNLVFAGVDQRLTSGIAVVFTKGESMMNSKQLKGIILAIFIVVLGATPALSQGQTIYNTIPKPLPGNLVSLGYEATSTAEFGDRVAFAGLARNATTVTVTLSSWGCQAGNWFSANCVTTRGATFSHKITLHIFAVGLGNQPGSLLASVTKTFAIPFRPSADARCAGAQLGEWYDSKSKTCFNGLATNITFNLAPLSLVLPNQVIIGVAYNTTHYGAAPIGQSAACFTSSGGCGYDSLNVALIDPATSLSIGSNPAPNDAYWNTLVAGWYCDGGAGGFGTFRLDAGPGCWLGFKPSVKIKAHKKGCKNCDDDDDDDDDDGGRDDR
jgi:hypothetical protein